MTTTHTEVICPNCDETHPSALQMFRLSVFAKQSHYGAITHTCISCTEPEEVGMVAWHKAMGTWLSHRDIMRLLAEHDLAGADMTELGNIDHGIAAHTLYAWMGY